jgi:hypothetical protein
MDLNAAIELAESLIVTKAYHQDYSRVCRLRRLYRQLITGENAKTLLERFIKREDPEMFAQRERLTELIVKPLAASLTKPFYKVMRNNKVTKRIDVPTDVQRQVVDAMLTGFYGDPINGDGMDYWLQNQFVELSALDPNAWLIVEFDPYDLVDGYPQPRPFIATADEAVNFRINNGVLEWLMLREEINVPTLATTKQQRAIAGKNRHPEAPDTVKSPFGDIFINGGYQWTLYTDTIAIQYQEVDPEYISKYPDDIPPGSQIVKLALDGQNGRTYARTITVPNFGFVQAQRIGYARDAVTDGRTFVNIFDTAVPYFMKSVKACSELDMSIAMHVFPQKIQYVARCKGKDLNTPCNGGKVPSGDTCTVCKGSGWYIPTSTQDTITLPMPANKDDMMPLENIIKYVAPDTAVLEFMVKYMDDIPVKCHMAVYNSTVFVIQQLAKTATEKDMDMDSVYDTLSPFAKKASALYMFVGKCAVSMARVPQGSGTVVHAFPSDLKLKTLAMLVAEYKDLSDSNAPSFVKDAINDDIANLLYQADPEKTLQYQVKKYFAPFKGKTDDQIAALLESQYTTEFNKVLWVNFDDIFADIERDDRVFYFRTAADQWQIIQDKVNDLLEQIEKEQVKRINSTLLLPGGDTGDPVEPTEEEPGSDPAKAA